MKRVYLLTWLALSLLPTRHSNAQQSTPAAFTLEQCIEYALQNSINAQNAYLDQRVAAAKVKETIGLGLPQISVDASVAHNPKLQRFFTTYNPDGGFIDLSGVPGIQPGDVVGAKNFFQLQSSGAASATLNQLIFNGSYIVGLQASRTFKELSAKTANQTKEQIVQQVMKAYYAVLINNERTELFTNNIARVDSLFRNTKALNQNGFAESIDVDRIQVTLNNLRTERDKFLKLNDLGLELLKFQMNYPMDQPIKILGRIQDVQVDTNLDNYKKDWDYKIRPDYQVLETNKKLQELNIKNQYAGAMPSIVAFASIGYSTQSPNVSGLFRTESDISDEGGLGPDKWYNFSQIGVSLNYPLFTGLQRHYKIQQEKLNLIKVENGFRSLKNGIDLEIKQSSIQFENALNTLTSQKENMELAGKVASVTRIKYEQGVGSNLEVVDAENSLRQAQTNYYTALFDAMIAKVDLDKAYGKLIPSTSQK